MYVEGVCLGTLREILCNMKLFTSTEEQRGY